MEIPVVASDTAGNRELVRDGETGLLCPSEDPAALADRIERFLRDPQRALLMAGNGRKLVREEFSLERSIDDTNALYLRLGRSVHGRNEDRDRPPRTRIEERD